MNYLNSPLRLLNIGKERLAKTSYGELRGAQGVLEQYEREGEIRLRGHHFNRFFIDYLPRSMNFDMTQLHDKKYGKECAEAFSYIYHLVRDDPSLPIRPVKGLDVMCMVCPNMENSCKYVGKEDRAALKSLKISSRRVYTSQEIFDRIKQSYSKVTHLPFQK